MLYIIILHYDPIDKIAHIIISERVTNANSVRSLKCSARKSWTSIEAVVHAKVIYRIKIYARDVGLNGGRVRYKAHMCQTGSTRFRYRCGLVSRRAVRWENRKPREIQLFGLARSSNYLVYSIYITYTNARIRTTTKPPPTPLNVATLTRRRPHGNRSNYRRVSGTADWIQKLCRWRNNIRHTFARVNIELSFLVIPRENKNRSDVPAKTDARWIHENLSGFSTLCNYNTLASDDTFVSPVNKSAVIDRSQMSRNFYRDD